MGPTPETVAEYDRRLAALIDAEDKGQDTTAEKADFTAWMRANGMGEGGIDTDENGEP